MEGTVSRWRGIGNIREGKKYVLSWTGPLPFSAYSPPSLREDVRFTEEVPRAHKLSNTPHRESNRDRVLHPVEPRAPVFDEDVGLLPLPEDKFRVVKAEGIVEVERTVVGEAVEAREESMAEGLRWIGRFKKAGKTGR